MREEYDFKNARKNPYVQKERKLCNININSINFKLRRRKEC